MSMQDSPITDTRDLLGAIPILMGFRPEHSLVILCTTPDGLLGPIARADFPDDHAAAAALLNKLGLQLHSFGVTHLITVLYTRHVEPEHAPGVRAVLEALWATTEATGLHTIDVWHVGPPSTEPCRPLRPGPRRTGPVWSRTSTAAACWASWSPRGSRWTPGTVRTSSPASPRPRRSTAPPSPSWPSATGGSSPVPGGDPGLPGAACRGPARSGAAVRPAGGRLHR